MRLADDGAVRLALHHAAERDWVQSTENNNPQPRKVTAEGLHQAHLLRHLRAHVIHYGSIIRHLKHVRSELLFMIITEVQIIIY